MDRNAGHPKWILAALIAAATILPGCSDILSLEEEPRGFASPENFYTTPEQVEAVFVASMGRLWSSWSGYQWAMRPFFLHDDQMHGGDLNIPQNHGAPLWQAHYSNIANLNFAIRAMLDGKLQGVAQADLDVLMGQAKFLRAHNYFMLVRLWGALPLPTENTENPFTTDLPRTPIAGVYELITSDLTEAANKLPYAWPEDRKARPTSLVAKAYLAKVYLTMASHPLNDPSNYAKAAQLAQEVIADGKHYLIDDVTTVFTGENEFAPEMMWMYVSTPEHRALHPQTWSHMNGWGDHSVQQEWLDDYPEQPRKYAYMEIYSIQDGHHHLESGHRAGLKKMLYGNLEDIANSVSYANMPILRYADVLLIFAEAENMVNGGPTQEAVDAVNQIIDRANGYEQNPQAPLLTTSMTQEEFDAAVIAERDRELCFEYDRWFDLVRKRILEAQTVPQYRQNFSEADYLWPIPENDIRLNEMLEQNPGY